MKQAIIELKKKLLIVELPEGAIDVHVNDLVYKNKVSFRTNTSLHLIETKENLLGESPKLVGKLTDITEEQFAEWVEKFYDGAIRDYREGSFDPADDLANFCLTAQESFFSYLELQGIYFGNPYGEEPFVPFYAPYGMTIEEYNLELRAAEYKKGEWQEAEEKVWSKDNCYIFEII